MPVVDALSKCAGEPREHICHQGEEYFADFIFFETVFSPCVLALHVAFAFAQKSFFVQRHVACV